MNTLLKSLIGNGSKDRETLEAMATILREVQQERGRNEEVLERVEAAIERLGHLSEPIEKAGSDVDAVSAGVADLGQRLEALARLAESYQSVAERAETLARDQQRSEARIAEVMEDARKITEVYGQIGGKVDLALALGDRLEAFLEVEKPFQVLRGDADGIRTQIEGTGEQIARLRELHDRLLDNHRTAVSKMEAMDRRREELGRDLQDKERRVSGVEQAVRGMDGIQQTVEEVRRQIGTIKALGDVVAQKTAGLEAQREAVESAVARADDLDRAMRQLDAGLRHVEQNEKTVAAVQEEVASLQKLCETVVDRSREIAQLQRQADQQAQATRQDLAAVRDETKKTMERIEFESKGLESVDQRVADLRGLVSDLEARFGGVSESSVIAGELRTQTQSLSTQLQTLTVGVGRVDEELSKLQAMRRELDEAGRIVHDVDARAARIEQSRPGLELALEDLEKLAGVQATVKDALEQAQLAQEEIVRVRESQSETRGWLAGVEGAMSELRDRAGQLDQLVPSIETAQKRADRVLDSIAALDGRREFLEQLHRKIGDFASITTRLDERGAQLQQRMEAAEQQIAGLTTQAAEAERLSGVLSAVSSGLSDAAAQSEVVLSSVAAIEARCGSVEDVAERTRALGQEIEQRQHALEQAAKDLRKASDLRQKAAAAAQKLDEEYRRLATALAGAQQQVEQVDTLSAQLEDRKGALQLVDRQLTDFEERMGRWSVVDQEIARSLEQISSRQSTIESLRADLERMFATAEKTAADVRAITTSQREIADTRVLLEEHRLRLREIRDTASALDDRQRQMARAEERLARSEALLVDVRASLETLQGQKALVDQAVEKAGSLRFLLKQAEAMIDGLREERKMTTDYRSAVAIVEEGGEELAAA